MPIHKKLRTPYIKPRTQGGTFYTFSSALEDIGLNINELRNKVSMSHYVLLNIPSFTGGTYDSEKVNVGDYSFAEILQNYGLNMETVLRNQPYYSFTESLTVSERVFWKMMSSKFGAEFEKIDGTDYWEETTGLIKGFGQITAGSQRTDAYGIYNETLIQIPSSYGRMRTLFKQVSDRNCHTTDANEIYECYSNNGYIENVDENDIDSETGLLPTGISATAMTDTNGGYTVDGNELMSVVFSLPELRDYFGDDTLTYDTMGIQATGIEEGEPVNSYEFNAILVYYSIYDTNGNTLATNAYGILLLNNAVASGSSFVFPTITKVKTTNTTTGNSYAFRINIKTSTVYSGDVVVHDESTGAYEMTTEFNDVIRNLGVAINTLKSNANLIASISDSNETIKKLAMKSLQKIDDIEKDINNLKKGSSRRIKAGTVIADTAQIGNLSGPIQFNSEKGTVLGGMNEEGFEYKKISTPVLWADDASAGALTTPILAAKNDVINFTNEGRNENFATFSAGKAFLNGDIFIPSNSSSEDSQSTELTDESTPDSGNMDAIFAGMAIYHDGNGGYRMTLPNLSDQAGAGIMLNSLYMPDSVNSDNPGNTNIYNLCNMLYLAMAEICILRKKVDELAPSESQL